MYNARPTARTVLLNARHSLSGDDLDALEQRFFNQLVMANGTLKTTFANRLPDIDSACNALLLKAGRAVRLLDIGISSGVTTHEWISSLNSKQIEFNMEAFDLSMDASILSYSKHFHVLVDSAEKPLQFEIFGRAEANFLGESLSRKVKRFFPVLALRLCFAICKRVFARAATTTPVKLASHRLKSATNVRIFEYDVSAIDELDGQYDMIRAANILNLAYFETSFLSETISKIKDKLAENGFLCVVRTNSAGVNNGSIYQFSNGSLTPVLHIGAGSEIDELVT